MNGIDLDMRLNKVSDLKVLRYNVGTADEYVAVEWYGNASARFRLCCDTQLLERIKGMPIEDYVSTHNIVWVPIVPLETVPETQEA